MSDHLKKVEEELLPEIELAALKGNMNRVIAALTASLTELVEHAKLAEQAAKALGDLSVEGDLLVDGSVATTTPDMIVDKAPTKKAPTRKPAKKAPAKKTAE